MLEGEVDGVEGKDLKQATLECLNDFNSYNVLELLVMFISLC